MKIFYAITFSLVRWVICDVIIHLNKLDYANYLKQNLYFILMLIIAIIIIAYYN